MGQCDILNQIPTPVFIVFDRKRHFGGLFRPKNRGQQKQVSGSILLIDSDDGELGQFSWGFSVAVLVLPDLNQSRLENRLSIEALKLWDNGYRLHRTCLNFTWTRQKIKLR